MSLFLLFSIPTAFSVIWNQFNRGKLGGKEIRSQILYSLLALASFGLLILISGTWIEFDYLPGQALLHNWWYDHLLVVFSIIIPGIFIFRAYHEEERTKLYLKILAYTAGMLSVMNLIHLLSYLSFISVRDLFILPFIYIVYLTIVPLWLVLLIHPRRLYLILGLVLVVCGTILMSLIDLFATMRDIWATTILLVLVTPLVILSAYYSYRQLYDPGYLSALKSKLFKNRIAKEA